MLNIILILLIIGLCIAFWPVLVALLILYIIYMAFSWQGVVIAIAVVAGLGVLHLGTDFLGKTIREHDKKKKEIAQINKKTQEDKQSFENEKALLNELNSNCRWLGYMNDEMWKNKLPNFANKQYNTSFLEITRNFAIQMEQQNIKQNDEWFDPFLRYILEHPQGATVTKMLNEVSCPQFRITHATPDGDILNTKLMKGTERKNKDVPPLLEKCFINEMNEYIFTPTKYMVNLYGASEQQDANNVKELDFNDL